eukprot:TRINITY_DN244_c0_g1_i1.p1 TRINITY_DN244_c0_g1~~TRINITY_DN244_c0_g1_i1.p1  ORF type:complete len:427 (-),score=73.16 TRINITY_DN244_c0_g1_i1:204-1484(-)
MTKIKNRKEGEEKERKREEEQDGKKVQYKVPTAGHNWNQAASNLSTEDRFQGEDEIERKGVFKGFRKDMRDWLLVRVKEGAHTIVQIQKSKSDFKTHFWEFVSTVGTHNFQIAFFPFFWFALGRLFEGRNLVFVVILGIYCGNWAKDYFCLPRPTEPAMRLSFQGSKEFGFPSTHAITATCLSFSLVLLLTDFLSLNFFVGILLALVYISLVSFSRVYLGMHCVTDIVGGIIIGLSLIVFWFGFGVINVVDNYLLDNFWAIPISIIAGILMLYFHPEPAIYCPCFEDTTCSVGSAIGVASSVYVLSHHQWNNHSPFAMFVRYVVGVGVMVLVRFVLKPLMWKIIPWFYEVFDFKGRKFLPHLSVGSSTKHLEMRVVPSLSNIHNHHNPGKKPPHDVDIPTKYIVYWFMCFSIPAACAILDNISWVN